MFPVHVSVVAYTRFKFFWGLVEHETGSNPYTSAQKASLGASAVAPSGIGVRRAQLVFTRTPPGAFAEDVAVMHFDFLNITSGSADDTWTTGDYTTLETNITAFWTAVKSFCTTEITLKEIRWYRIGSGVVPPNPPQRITAIGAPGLSSGAPLPPQCACSISFHVAPRR